MKLSIVIPVYRVEATLDRCLESVVGQHFDDFEVILVDDGSPDSCPRLCDDWAGRDARITVVHKENGGLSDARNAGIDKAQGEFVTFVDSDDFLAPDTFAQVMPLAQQADIVEFPLFWHYGAQEQHTVAFPETVYTDMSTYWLQGRAYEHAFAWNKIYRRELFGQDVRFPVGKVFEDVWTLPLLLHRARRVVTTGKGLYYYCINHEGITQTATGEQLLMLLEAHLVAMNSWLDDRYYMHVLNIQLDVCNQTSRQPQLPQRHIALHGIPLTAKQKIKAFLLNLLGMNLLCKTNAAIYKWKGNRS